ncbi:uroporphyrinogen-III C-methyltransferase [Marinimicrococcus flavescens]|uniref:uroporphyrinogen-III C-methyltransferase n=1 Tax=Marinimicrococcus flavescens TaxID=3031815 RepID=A0AAP4D737_9PROT|nr:uroporphyrinogen-III C-methyltransferase [Marinimicrococcus flavescens]
MSRDPLLPDLAPGEVWLVGAGPGDPGLLTLLARHALAQAELVLHDALVPPAILAMAGPDARFEPVGKRAGRPSAVQMRINARLLAHAGAGRRVVRLKGGDPFVFGRGGEEALALRAAGVPFRVVPGVSSGTAAPALAGIPVTHRNLARSVAFVTGSGSGGAAPAHDWQALSRGADTLVLFMAGGRIGAIAREIMAAGRAPGEPLALIAAAGTPEQTRILSRLGEAAEAAARLPPGLPVLAVVGPTVGLAHLLAPDLPGGTAPAFPAPSLVEGAR